MARLGIDKLRRAQVCADPETVDIINQVPDKRLPKEVQNSVVNVERWRLRAALL